MPTVFRSSAKICASENRGTARPASARAIRTAGNIGLDALEQIGVLGLQPLEATGEVVDILAAGKLQPDLGLNDSDGPLNGSGRRRLG